MMSPSFEDPIMSSVRRLYDLSLFYVVKVRCSMLYFHRLFSSGFDFEFFGHGAHLGPVSRCAVAPWPTDASAY